MKKTYFLIFLILVLFLFSGCRQIPEDADCVIDEGCVKVQTTCCSCNMGGKEECVPRKDKELYEAKDCPEGIMCIALYNCKDSVCVCENNKCVEKENE